MKKSREEEEKARKESKTKREEDKKIDEEVEESFPASDSPQHNGTHI